MFFIDVCFAFILWHEVVLDVKVCFDIMAGDELREHFYDLF